MIEKARTALWFANRPDYWAHGLELGLRKLRPDHDRPQMQRRAAEWARGRARSTAEALVTIGLLDEGNDPPKIDRNLIQEGSERAKLSAVTMGGAGDLDLLYAAVSVSGAKRIVETGVAYGWSSLAILAALEGRNGARLTSVDMPYPKMNNEDFVGIVVPDRLKAPWTLIRQPDRGGLSKAIATTGGEIDLCHYDSDKSWWGRMYGYRLLWRALVPGGIFISDDIQDNMAFAEFMHEQATPVAVTEFEGKFVGITRKKLTG